ncbi:hypothetical protein SUDANB95_07962 (plasmid) [Actinosynnema sp. ALI-1.44]
MADLLGELVVCDQCWHVAGGAEAIRARALSLMEGGDQPVLAMDPLVEEMLAGANPLDMLHPTDRLLVDSGVRWSVARHIVPKARVELAKRIAERSAPSGTAASEDAVAWLAVVTQHIASDQEEFKQPRGSKRRRWWRILRVYAICADRQGRPLTWAAHEVVAEAVGCSTKTVQRALRWAERRGLLWEVVPGCVLPKASSPTDETPAEREDRLAREAVAEAEAVAAEEAARARAKAELDAVRVGFSGPLALAVADLAIATPAPAVPDPDDVEGEREQPTVRLTPVYELRVPLSGDELAERKRIAAALTPPPPSAGQLLAEQHREHWVHPVNAGLYGALVVIGHDGSHVLVHGDTDAAYEAFQVAVEAVISGNAVKLVRTTSFVHPPQVSSVEEMNLLLPGVVDKRAASRRSDDGSSVEVVAELPSGGRTEPGEAKKPSRPKTAAEQAADWLLREGLDPLVCGGVSRSWLSAVIAGSGLLRHEWTLGDLRDLIHGEPAHPHLPRFIREPKAWIRAQFAAADPVMPPRKARFINEVERSTQWFAARRASERQAKRQAEIAARRAAIDACKLCDEVGWLHVTEGPTVRCSHDQDTGGW